MHGNKQVGKGKELYTCVGIDFTRAETPGIIDTFILGFPLGCIQELLVPLQTLGGGPAHNGSNGTPLGGHQLGKMEEFLVFFTGPLSLLDAIFPTS